MAKILKTDINSRYPDPKTVIYPAYGYEDAPEATIHVKIKGVCFNLDEEIFNIPADLKNKNVLKALTSIADYQLKRGIELSHTKQGTIYARPAPVIEDNSLYKNTTPIIVDGTKIYIIDGSYDPTNKHDMIWLKSLVKTFRSQVVSVFNDGTVKAAKEPNSLIWDPIM